MVKISQKQQKIISLLIQKSTLSSSQIHSKLTELNEQISLITVKRELAKMTTANLILAEGSGRSRVYRINISGRIFAEIDAHSYTSIEPDRRFGLSRYNPDLFVSMPPDIFSKDEIEKLDKATAKYNQRTKDSPPAIQKKELERLIIELSWKSSKIEGNTYTLLDTEKLILENREAPGHDKKEAVMILNHKEAFTFIYKNAIQFQTLTRTNLEQLHKILVKGLSINFGFRQKPVGVIGSKYQPLDNIYQIAEAVNDLSAIISKVQTVYAKALLALLGLSYIQPFEDGNKRTSRLMANALLLAHQHAPLSYRSIDENEYREAMLVFYEVNSIQPSKKIFVDQYEFAAENYAVKSNL